jgi:hypothetical protein
MKLAPRILANLSDRLYCPKVLTGSKIDQQVNLSIFLQVISRSLHRRNVAYDTASRYSGKYSSHQLSETTRELII